MRKFWTLLTREVRSYFYSPIAYIVMIFFLIISGIDFYFQVSFMNQRQVQYTIQEAFFNSVFFLVRIRPDFSVDHDALVRRGI